MIPDNSVAEVKFQDVIQNGDQVNDDEDQDPIPMEPAYSNHASTTLKHRVRNIFLNSLAKNQLKQSVLRHNFKSLQYHDAFLRNHIFEEVIHSAQFSSIGEVMTNEIAPMYKYDSTWELMDLNYGTFPLWVQLMKSVFDSKFGSSEILFKPFDQLKDEKSQYAMTHYKSILIKDIKKYAGEKNTRKKVEGSKKGGSDEDDEFLPPRLLELLSELHSPYEIIRVLHKRHMIGIQQLLQRSSPFIAKLLVSPDLTNGLTLQTHTLLHKCISAFWSVLEPVSMLFFAHPEISKSTFMAAIIYTTLTSNPQYKHLMYDSQAFYTKLPSLFNLFYLLLDLAQQTSCPKLETLPTRQDFISNDASGKLAAFEVKKRTRASDEDATNGTVPIIANSATPAAANGTDSIAANDSSSVTTNGTNPVTTNSSSKPIVLKDIPKDTTKKTSSISMIASKVMKDQRNNKPPKTPRTTLPSKAKMMSIVQAIVDIKIRIDKTSYAKDCPNFHYDSPSKDPMFSFYVMSYHEFYNIVESGSITELKALMPEYRTVLVVGILAAARRIHFAEIKESKKGFFGWLTDNEELKALLPHLPRIDVAVVFMQMYHYIEKRPCDREILESIDAQVKFDTRLDFLYHPEFATCLSFVMEQENEALFLLLLIHRSFEWKKQLRMLDINEHQKTVEFETILNKMDSEARKTAEDESLVWFINSHGPHFCCREEYFDRLDKFPTPIQYQEQSSANLASAEEEKSSATASSLVNAWGTGTVKISVRAKSTSGDDRIRQLILQDVLFVPEDMKYNVLSLSGPGIHKPQYADMHNISLGFPNKSKKSQGKGAKSRPAFLTAYLENFSPYYTCIVDYGRLKSTSGNGDKNGDPSHPGLTLEEAMRLEVQQHKLPRHGTYTGIGELVLYTGDIKT